MLSNIKSSELRDVSPIGRIVRRVLPFEISCVAKQTDFRRRPTNVNGAAFLVDFFVVFDDVFGFATDCSYDTVVRRAIRRLGHTISAASKFLFRGIAIENGFVNSFINRICARVAKNVDFFRINMEKLNDKEILRRNDSHEVRTNYVVHHDLFHHNMFHFSWLAKRRCVLCDTLRSNDAMQRHDSENHWLHSTLTSANKYWLFGLNHVPLLLVIIVPPHANAVVAITEPWKFRSVQISQFTLHM